jgi:hypothetical protein
MSKHPKYTLIATSHGAGWPFVIMEHSDMKLNGKPGIGSRQYLTFDNLGHALIELARLSDGPVTLAYSAQAIDNTFDILKD